MISLDLAPNEDYQDALKSLTMLLQPWRWMKGQQSSKLKIRLKRFFPEHDIFFYLSARGALYKLLQALKLQENDQVAVVGFTCEAVILPLTELKLTPVFIDAEKESYSLDFSDLKRKLTAKTKVIILQHSFGITPEYREEILLFAKASKIPVVEDLAHGFDNSLFAKDKAESIKLLSFGRSKALSSVFGGALVTKDKKLQETLKIYDKRLITPRTSFVARCLLYKPLSVLIKATYDLAKIGKILHWLMDALHVLPKELSAGEKAGQFNPQMASFYPNALAFLLIEQLKRFETLQDLRKKNVREYNDAFHSTKLDQPLGRYPVLVPKRDELVVKLRQQGIYLGTWYKKLVSPEGACPTADLIKNQIINLPTHVNSKQRALVMKHVELHAFHHQLS